MWRLIDVVSFVGARLEVLLVLIDLGVEYTINCTVHSRW